jgi:NAD(P)-dependent dehydrogenase (short-subunit alcohol dehydrogenase family)
MTMMMISGDMVVGWSCRRRSPIVKKIQKISRRAFFTGVATGVVVGTAATAGAAVALNEQINNNSRAGVYTPPQGSLVDQIVLITGGTTGLGLESAKRLASAGASVVLTSRTATKGEKAVDSVLEYLTKAGIENKKVYSLVLDLDDLESVKAFPSSYKALKLGDISVLLNNAGVMAIPDRQLTKDGYERTFQSNHLGHFVLTSLLYPLLSRTKATVINVSSEAYNFARGGLDLANINGENQYGPWTSYGQSKLMNILFTQELQRRADANGDGSWLTAVTLHPGAVSTDLGRYLVGEEKWNDLKTRGPSGLESFALNALSVFTKTVPEGASTQVFLAAGGDGKIEKSAFYEDMKVKNLPAFAKDAAKAKQLWEKSEELGGVVFDISRSTGAGGNSSSSMPTASTEATS